MNFTNERNQIITAINQFNKSDFDELALRIFFFQKKYNEVYATFLRLIGKSTFIPSSYAEIPFLPIRFFKNFPIKTGIWKEKKIFRSSGTTSLEESQHLVRDPSFYLSNIMKGFEAVYGNPEDYVFFGLLPSYLERADSSLIFMVQHLLSKSKSHSGGFFLRNFEQLKDSLQLELDRRQRKVFLIGVTYALLDFGELYDLDLGDAIVMETGGMKGRRKEMIREELHHFLLNKLGISSVHSEYGMTELFSQAYAPNLGKFYPSSLLKVLPREITDPMAIASFNSSAALNLIDLANFDTISFIASDDLGKVYSDGTFEVLGRLNNTDIRGCNLMVS
jgi:hypothetical protein